MQTTKCASNSYTYTYKHYYVMYMFFKNNLWIFLGVIFSPAYTYLVGTPHF